MEGVLEQHPAVTEAGVTGRPDAEWGEAVTAFVVGDAAEDELPAHARQRLAAHEVPKSLSLLMPCRAIGRAS